MKTNDTFKVKLVHCGNRTPHQGNFPDKYIFYMPMGIFSLAGILNKNGIDTEIIHLDLEVGEDIEEILEIRTTDAVGLDIHWVNQAPAALKILEIIKKIKPGIFTFIGGYTASYYAKEILAHNRQVDMVIRGDAEIPIVELCCMLRNYKTQSPEEPASLPNKWSPGNVQNLVWREKNGHIIVNPLTYTASAEEMDRFEFTGISLLRNWKYYRDTSRFWTGFSTINTQPLFFLEIGRGCMYNCLICGGNANAQVCLNNRKSCAIRSIDSVMASVKEAFSFGYTAFLTSFEFDDSAGWYARLFRRIRQEKLEMSIAYESWGLLSESLIDEMCAAFQQVMVTISPDSADPGLRRKNKDPRLFYTNRELEDRLDYIATKSNMKVQLYFGYFLPYETGETIYKTMEYICRLSARYSHFVEFIYMNNNTDPGSGLYLNPGRYNAHLAVSSLEDYIGKINENYRMEQGKPVPQTLLSRPADMGEADAVNLANQVTLFNRLFYYRDSLAAIARHLGSTAAVPGYLSSLDLSTAGPGDFACDAVKEILTAICDKYVSPGSPAALEIHGNIDREYRQEAFGLHYKNLTYYTCRKGEKEVISDNDKKKIGRDIRKARQNIQADFDL